MKKLAVGVALSASSAVMAALAFGPYEVWPFVFVAFVPMVVAQHRVLPERWSGLAFAVGIGGFVTGYLVPIIDPSFAWWMKAIPVVLVLPFFFLGRLDRRFHTRTAFRYIAFATPLVWVALDFARSWIPAVATRASLPYALFEHPSLIQPISVTGISGLNLLIVASNWTIAAIVLGKLRLRTGVVVATAALVWVGASVAMLRSPEPTVRVAAIQPGVRSADSNEYERNVAQTRAAAARGARLIVWREMSMPVDPAIAKRAELRSLARETGAYLVVGYFIETPTSLRNEATVIAPDGTFLGSYSKQHPALMFAGDAKATRGRVFPVYKTPIGRLAAIICFDLDFTDTSRGMARNGAQLVAVPSMDPPGDATKHYPLLVFRAVENRLTMVKAETKFASAIIDPYGRILNRAVARDGTRATLIADVPLGSANSIFVSIGEAFGLLTIAAATGLHLRLSPRWRSWRPPGGTGAGSGGSGLRASASLLLRSVNAKAM